MIMSLLVALAYIGILVIIGYAAIAIFEWATDKPIPRPFAIIFKAVVGVVCILVLIQALTGDLGLDWPGLHRLK